MAARPDAPPAPFVSAGPGWIAAVEAYVARVEAQVLEDRWPLADPSSVLEGLRRGRRFRGPDLTAAPAVSYDRTCRAVAGIAPETGRSV